VRNNPNPFLLLTRRYWIYSFVSTLFQSIQKSSAFASPCAFSWRFWSVRVAVNTWLEIEVVNCLTSRVWVVCMSFNTLMQDEKHLLGLYVIWIRWCTEMYQFNLA
jgi:hypothetical protein